MVYWNFSYSLWRMVSDGRLQGWFSFTRKILLENKATWKGIFAIYFQSDLF